MNTGPLEATVWTLLIIAVLFFLGFSVLASLEWLRNIPARRRGLELTPKEKGLMAGMAALAVPPLVAELLLATFSPYLLLATILPLTIAAMLLARRLDRRSRGSDASR